MTTIKTIIDSIGLYMKHPKRSGKTLHVPHRGRHRSMKARSRDARLGGSALEVAIAMTGIPISGRLLLVELLRLSNSGKY